MRKREVLAEFKKTVKSCLKHIECGFNDYTYVPKYNHIRYDDNYDITHINVEDGIHGYMISLINIDESKRCTPEYYLLKYFIYIVNISYKSQINKEMIISLLFRLSYINLRLSFPSQWKNLV